MANAYYHLLGHIFAAVHACDESGDLAASLAKAGFKKERVAAGKKLAREAEALIEKKDEELGEDRIRSHGLHASCAELEMWMQTIAFEVKKKVEEESVVGLVLAAELHAHDHAVTASARALRMMSMMRCDERVFDRLGGAKRTRSLLNRGHSLSKKVFKSGEIKLRPAEGEGSEAIFDELHETRSAMEAWLRELDAAATKAADKDERLIGRLGYVPDGVGIPAGGTSYAVVLHERGQTEAPDPRDVKDCSGWSIGRQGRNRENLGKGWVTSEA